jgi:hypothetical protein
MVLSSTGGFKLKSESRVVSGSLGVEGPLVSPQIKSVIENIRIMFTNSSYDVTGRDPWVVNNDPEYLCVALLKM